MNSVSEIKSSLLSYESFPSLASQLKEEAQAGLALETKSFKELKHFFRYLRLPECDFDHFYPEAIKIINGRSFRKLPGPLNRLMPLAMQYQEKFKATERALGESGSIDDLVPILKSLADAHDAFEGQFRTECIAAAPLEPFAIISKYPKALRLYYTAFLSQLNEISRETYAKWRDHAGSMSEEALALFPRLAIYHLLVNPELSIPELFLDHAVEIGELRGSFKALQTSEREALLGALRFESDAAEGKVRSLFIRIGQLSSDLQFSEGRAFNGIARIVFNEANIAFSLLGKIVLKEFPRSVELQSRAVMLAFLKQDSLSPDQLPYDFSGGKIEEAALSMHAEYQRLDDGEKQQFDALFLSNGKSSEKKIRSLLLDWEKMYWLWAERTLFPLHLLACTAFKRAVI